MALERCRGKIFHQIATNVLYCKHYCPRIMTFTIKYINENYDYVDQNRRMQISKHEITSITSEIDFIGLKPDTEIRKSHYMYFT